MSALFFLNQLYTCSTSRNRKKDLIKLPSALRIASMQPWIRWFPFMGHICHVGWNTYSYLSNLIWLPCSTFQCKWSHWCWGPAGKSQMAWHVPYHCNYIHEVSCWIIHPVHLATLKKFTISKSLWLAISILSINAFLFSSLD